VSIEPNVSRRRSPSRPRPVQTTTTTTIQVTWTWRHSIVRGNQESSSHECYRYRRNKTSRLRLR